MRQAILNFWNTRDSLTETNKITCKKTVEEIISQLDKGIIRVAEKQSDKWNVNEWIKQAILLYFKLNSSKVFEFGGMNAFDKIPLKTSNWNADDFFNAGFRMVPGTVIRKSAFIAKNVVLMPCFVNVGAYIDEGTMIDTYVNVGSSAQIGKNCHISVGVGIGGVLEPLQATPVIIEDNVFIGAGCQVTEGAIVEEGSILGMGCMISASTKIYDKTTDETFYGLVPKNSVVIPGAVPSSDGKSFYNGAIIIKKVSNETRKKVSINELLREG